MAETKTPPKWPVLFLTIVAIVGAVLCVIWFVRVWRGDNNPTDRTVLLIFSLLTVASGVSVAVMAKKRGS